MRFKPPEQSEETYSTEAHQKKMRDLVVNIEVAVSIMVVLLGFACFFLYQIWQAVKV